MKGLKEDYVKECARLQRELVDQSNRNRRNNVVVYNLPEGVEGDHTLDLTKYVQTFLSETLELPSETF